MMMPGGQAAVHECDHRPADDGFAGVGASFVVPDQAPLRRSQAKDRSTTQRRGRGWKPRTSSGRRTMSRTIPRCWSVQSVRWPV